MAKTIPMVEAARMAKPVVMEGGVGRVGAVAMEEPVGIAPQARVAMGVMEVMGAVGPIEKGPWSSSLEPSFRWDESSRPLANFAGWPSQEGSPAMANSTLCRAEALRSPSPWLTAAW